MTSPTALGDYVYRVTGYGGDGKVRHADPYVKAKSALFVDYWQGYVEYANHYYVVGDLRLEAKFVFLIDWRLEHEGSYVKVMKKDSKSSSKPLTVRLSWIRPKVQQVWSSPFSCVVRVYGIWVDDRSQVKGSLYLYYSLDLDGNRRLCLKTGMASSEGSYAEGDPVDPQSLRPTSYMVSKAVTILVTPAIEDFALMKGSVKYKELTIAVY